MLIPLKQLEQHISRTDQQLWYYMVLEQQETNRLLRLLTENKQETEPILKRPEIMKRMKTTNPPKGWQTWNNEKMLEHLKEVN